jgi:hypothetical protein
VTGQYEFPAAYDACTSVMFEFLSFALPVRGGAIFAPFPK